MLRHLRTISLFWSTSVNAELEYRSNFALACVTGVMTLAGSVFTLSILFQHNYQMGNWTWPQALIVMGVYTILDGFQQTFLAPNRTRIGEFVREGTLDFVLIKPIDSQFWLTFNKLSIWGLPNMVLGLAMVLYAGRRVLPALGPLDYIIGVVPLLLGIVVLYSLGFFLSTLTIWFIKLNNITFAMAALLEAGRYPIPAYPFVWRAAFTFVIPVAFMTTVPAKTLLGMPDHVPWLVAAFVVAGVMLLISRWFWRFALRSYTSASS